MGGQSPSEASGVFILGGQSPSEASGVFILGGSYVFI